jgi:hypothetical protein
MEKGDRTEVPATLERSEVPRFFRQFRDASVLKQLAHNRRGPLYQLIGRKAWYDTADIIAWLESRKQAGPDTPSERIAEYQEPVSSEPPKKAARRRGRPTKRAQRLRDLALRGN